MDNGSPFSKRRRLEEGTAAPQLEDLAAAASSVAARQGESTDRTAALEAELKRLRAENARLLQEQQQHRQQQQQQASLASASALLGNSDPLAALRSLTAPTQTTGALNLSALAQQRLSQLASLPTAATPAPAAQGLSGLSADQLLALLGGSASASRPSTTPGLASLPGLGGTSLASSLASTAAATTGSSLAGLGTTGLLGQAFQQRLQQVQQQHAQAKNQPPPPPADAKPPGLSEEMKERLKRLQQLSDLQRSSSGNTTSTTGSGNNANNLRPSLNPSALPSRLNNSNISAIDTFMKAHVPPAKKKAELKVDPAAITTTTPDEDSTKNDSSPGSRKRKPQLLYMVCDDEDLSQYQTEVRKQIEVFEADREDTSTSARGRNRPIVTGQVGIRCKHCKVVPPQHRQRAAIYYPSKLDRLYQMSQTIASVHLAEYCQHIPPQVRAELARLREAKSAALGGKKYWADAGRAMGLVEIDKRLFYGDGKAAQEAKQKLAEAPATAAATADSPTPALATQ